MCRREHFAVSSASDKNTLAGANVLCQDLDIAIIVLYAL